MKIFYKILHYLGPNSPLGLVGSGIFCGLLVVCGLIIVNFVINFNW